jgi:soluble lytic murein transglycosylase-like protein
MEGVDAMRRLLVALFVLSLTAPLAAIPAGVFASGTSTVSRSATYTVKRGDTLTKIARRYGLSSWRVLFAVNRDRIRNPNRIRVGQVLRLPQGLLRVKQVKAAPQARVVALRAPAPAAAPAPASNTIVGIITAAAQRYGQSPAAMIRVAKCESGLNPRAVNRSSGASGLFQFLPSTWRTTPYASSSIFDATANANAAAWMWSVGRRGEWVCQ